MRLLSALVVLCAVSPSAVTDASRLSSLHHRITHTQGIMQADTDTNADTHAMEHDQLVTGGPEDCPYKAPFDSILTLRRTVFYEYEVKGAKVYPSTTPIPGTPGFKFETEMKTDRVMAAEGFIKTGGGTDPAAWIYPYVYCQYYHSVPFNDKPDPSDSTGKRKLRSPVYNSNQMNAGHIIAASLGGSNDDPQNFFAQYEKSNKSPGTYFMMEALARDVQNQLTAGGWKTTGDIPCNAFIRIEFEYPALNSEGTNFSWWPSAGKYHVALSTPCGNALKAAGSTTPNIVRFVRDWKVIKNLVQSHIDKSTGDIVKGDGYVYTFSFLNANKKEDAQKW